MAQINITLNQEEILQLLKNNSQETFKLLLENSLNEILKAESAQQLQAEPYERTAERTDSRNGHRERSLVTRIGKITLKVPRHRNVPFRSLIFDNYTRSEAALIATMVEMVVNGVINKESEQSSRRIMRLQLFKVHRLRAMQGTGRRSEEFPRKTFNTRIPLGDSRRHIFQGTRRQ